MFVNMGLFLAFISLWAHAVSSSPLLRNFSDPNANLGRELIPLRMQCVANVIRSIPLEKTGAFLNIIEALKILAKEDFEGFTPLMTFRTHNYPQPPVALTSPTLSPIKRKYVIWGLLLAWAWLSHPGRARVTHFDLLWDDRPVGGIIFGSLDLYAQHDKNASNTAVKDVAKSKDFEPPIEGFSNLREFSDSQLAVGFSYFGGMETMTKDNMQLSLLYALSQMARYPVDTPIIDNWRPRFQEDRCLFFAQKIVSDLPLAFNFFWLIEATAVTATFIVRSGLYRNLNGLLMLDGHVIGNLMLFSRLHFNATSASAIAAL